MDHKCKLRGIGKVSTGELWNAVMRESRDVENRNTRCSHHHYALEVERIITNAKSVFTCSSSLIYNILSLQHSKTSSNQELCKSLHNHQLEFFLGYATLQHSIKPICSWSSQSFYSPRSWDYSEKRSLNMGLTIFWIEMISVKYHISTYQQFHITSVILSLGRSTAY